VAVERSPTCLAEVGWLVEFTVEVCCVAQPGRREMGAGEATAQNAAPPGATPQALRPKAIAACEHAWRAFRLKPCGSTLAKARAFRGAVSDSRLWRMYLGPIPPRLSVDRLRVEAQGTGQEPAPTADSFVIGRPSGCATTACCRIGDAPGCRYRGRRFGGRLS